MPASGGVQASEKDLVLLADQLSNVFEARDRVDESILVLEAARVRLDAMRGIPVSPRMVLAFRVFSAEPRSTESLAAMLDTLDAALDSTLRKAMPVVPLTVVSAPTVPMSPARPRPALNVLIAGLFGLVGSGFAALLREAKE